MRGRSIVLGILIIIAFARLWPVVSEASKRSSDLTEKVTKTENVVRTDYVDDQGTITYAWDKHYATVIKTSGESTLLEEYFDEKGNPAKQPMWHYALRREYDEEGHNYKVTFLGMDGRPIINRDGYSEIIRSFDSDGRIKEEMYYDLQENPVKTNTFISGFRKEYDSSGRNNILTYINQNGLPTACSQGYAIKRRTFYEEGPYAGKVWEELYYDPAGNPVSLSIGQYGVRKEYDEMGRITVLTYLDADGAPMILPKGYTIVKRTFYENDAVRTEMYYDDEGKQIALSEGQYGVMYVEGREIYLDINGNELFNLRSYLQNNLWVVCLIVAFSIIISAYLNRRLNMVMLVMYLACIVYITLMFRRGTGTQINLALFCANRQLLTNPKLREDLVKNTLLFVPLGAILYRLCPKKKMLLVPILISLCIEVVQFLTQRGIFEVDDIICNGIGGIIGYSIARLLINKAKLE